MILARLKSETAAQHRRLESIVDLPTALQTVTSYRRLIERFHGFYLPLEPAIAAFVEWRGQPFDLASSDAVAALERDLSALGLPAAAIARLPRCADLPPLPDLAAALGGRYVLEGAALGGQVISRLLRASLGITPESGGAFFHGHGAETGRRWQAFRALLTVYATTPATEEAMIAGARQTFAAFERWLTARQETDAAPFPPQSSAAVDAATSAHDDRPPTAVRIRSGGDRWWKAPPAYELSLT